MSKTKLKKTLVTLLIVLLVVIVTQITNGIPGIGGPQQLPEDEALQTQFNLMEEGPDYDLSGIPKFKDSPYVEINGNKPNYTDKELSAALTSFQNYSDLDELGRCQTAVSSVGQDLMPTEPRGSIGMIKPTGWHTIRYDDLITDGKYLYNRCHLIGYQLTGQNANEYNLITGTRYMNVKGMEPFENDVAKYIKDTNNHVLYRVTPVFKGNNLVASGVIMEAQSIEDNGKGICFCVYVYNEQPGIKINHKTGDSERL